MPRLHLCPQLGSNRAQPIVRLERLQIHPTAPVSAARWRASSASFDWWSLRVSATAVAIASRDRGRPGGTRKWAHLFPTDIAYDAERAARYARREGFY
jgi:hypothetical protein